MTVVGGAVSAMMSIAIMIMRCDWEYESVEEGETTEPDESSSAEPSKSSTTIIALALLLDVSFMIRLIYTSFSYMANFVFQSATNDNPNRYLKDTGSETLRGYNDNLQKWKISTLDVHYGGYIYQDKADRRNILYFKIVNLVILSFTTVIIMDTIVNGIIAIKGFVLSKRFVVSSTSRFPVTAPLRSWQSRLNFALFVVAPRVLFIFTAAVGTILMYRCQNGEPVECRHPIKMWKDSRLDRLWNF